MTKKSLLIFNHYATTPDMAGGTRHYDVGKVLAARGYDVTVIASACPHGDHSRSCCRNGEEYVVEDFLEAPGLRFVWIRTAEERAGLVSRAISMFSYLPRATAVARKLVHQHVLPEPTWVVGSCVHQFPGLAALRIAREHAVPFIYEVRDLWPETLGELGGWSQHHPAVVASRLVSQHLYRHADQVVTVLPGSESVIASYGVARAKSFTVENLHCRSLDDIGDDPASATAVTVGYVGALGGRRGLGLLVESLWFLPTEYNVTIVGTGTEQERAAVLRHARDIGVAGRLNLLPAVPHWELQRVCRTFTCGVLLIEDSCLNNRYCSPNKIFDFIAAACPSVVTGVPPLRELVRSLGIGIVVSQPIDSARVAAVIREVVENHAFFQGRCAAASGGLDWLTQSGTVDSIVNMVSK